MLLREDQGGLGFGPAELAAVGTELGAALFCSPILGSVLAGSCLAALEDAPAELVTAQADGAGLTLAVPSFPELAATSDHAVTATASGTAGLVTLSGTARLVADAGSGPVLLVAAATASGWLLAAAETGAPGLAVRQLETLDLTRRLSSVTFAATPARVLASGEPAAAALRAALACGQLALAADSAGLAAASLDRVLDHLRTRHQFGRALATFQALKHTCADLLVALETARTALSAASAVRDPAQLTLLAAAAKIKATEAASWITTEAIQLSGGIGFTWEHPAHLYYRRAKSNEQLLGTPAGLRRSVYRLLNAGREEEG
jgi:alkylation response protein AidB-like acyl-CoA dehydrogenase